MVSPSNAASAHDLDAAVGDPEQRVGNGDLRHRTFDRPLRAAVEDAGAPVDHQLGLLQVDQVVGQHEADTFVVDQRLAEGVARGRVGGRDLVGTSAGAQPAHAVRQARRRQPDLGVAEAFVGARPAVGSAAAAGRRLRPRHGRPASSCRWCRGCARSGLPGQATRRGTSWRELVHRCRCAPSGCRPGRRRRR